MSREREQKCRAGCGWQARHGDEGRTPAAEMPVPSRHPSASQPQDPPCSYTRNEKKHVERPGRSRTGRGRGQHRHSPYGRGQGWHRNLQRTNCGGVTVSCASTPTSPSPKDHNSEQSDRLFNRSAHFVERVDRGQCKASAPNSSDGMNPRRPSISTPRFVHDVFVDMSN